MANNQTSINNQHLKLANEAALAGGRAIMKVYNSADFGVEMKADNSPLTLADKAAHNAIVDILANTNLPILSEEGNEISYEDRSKWDLFWMIDPLDGTKEFIKRNGEFTVNIALIQNNKPIYGVVYTPVLDKLFYGGTQTGEAWLINGEAKSQLQHSKQESLVDLIAQEGIPIVASRSHRNKDTEDFIDGCNNPIIVSMGSSLKFLVLAEGNAHIYPRFAPTMEWDTAAADAVLRGLGYNVFIVEGGKPTQKPLDYNKEDLLNPYFIAH
mgnify:FL=1